LILSAAGTGGVARATINLANRLCEQDDVEIISVLRRREGTHFPVDPRVRLTWLLDEREGAPRRRRLPHLAGRPSRLRPTVAERAMSAATDRVIERALARLRPGTVLISTRPSLHLAAATWAPAHVRIVGQDHLNFPTRFANPRMQALLRHTLPRLDSWVVLTEADAWDYRAAFPEMTTPITVIRNALPWDPPPPGPERTARVAVAAGRLAPEKGFDRLVDAWARVAEVHPDWCLHIHGSGDLRDRLQQRIDAHGLTDRVLLRGYTADIRAAYDEASMYVMSSRHEGLPMVLLEAMSTGLPLVSFDCPRGPGEIVTPENGILVPDGDVPGLAAAITRLIGDPDLRRRLGEQGRRDALAYRWEAILADWRAHLDGLDRSRLVHG